MDARVSFVSAAERIVAVELLKLLDVHPGVLFTDARQKREYLGVRERIRAILLHEPASIVVDESDRPTSRRIDRVAAVADHLELHRCSAADLAERGAECVRHHRTFDENINACNSSALDRCNLYLGARGRDAHCAEVRGGGCARLAAEVLDDCVRELRRASWFRRPGHVTASYAALQSHQYGLLDVMSSGSFTDVSQHHRRAENDCGRIGDILSSDVWRRSVNCLEDRRIVPDVRRWSEAESAGESRREVAQDVAVHVRRDDDVELLRTHCELMCAIVDEDVLRLDLRISLCHLLEGVLEHSFGELHDVRFRCAVNALAPGGYRELERELDDLLASGAGDDLERLRDSRRLHVLDAGVQIFDVFADDYDVELSSGERRRDTRKLANRTNIPEGLEEGTERDVRALVAVADRSLERALEDDLGPLDGFDGLFRNAGVDSLCEGFSSGEADLGLDTNSGGLDDL